MNPNLSRFASLFAGRQDAYGTFEVAGSAPDAKGKVNGRGTTHRAPLTDDIWAAHLAGDKSLGVVPILEDNKCRFFAIDVDEYKSDDLHASLALKIKQYELPLLVFASKSGGAHLYCFLQCPIRAKVARRFAKKWMSMLNISKGDIFPGQDMVKPGYCGNWISLPYFGNTRKWMGVHGQGPQPLEEFLDYAEEHRHGPADLHGRDGLAQQLREMEAQEAGDDDREPPPCIASMLKQGVHEYRNNSVKQYSIFAKRAYPDGWTEKTHEFNHNICDQPLPRSEIAGILSGTARVKDPGYMCDKEGIKELCDYKKCRTLKFGIKDVQADVKPGDYDITHVEVYLTRPTTYVLSVNTQMLGIKQVVCEAKDLLSQPRMMELLCDTFHNVFNTMKPADYRAYIQNVMANRKSEMPAEEVPGGILKGHMLMYHLRNFIRHRVVTEGGVEFALKRNKVFYDGKTLHFPGHAFIEYLQTANVDFTTADWVFLKDKGIQTSPQSSETMIWNPTEVFWSEEEKGTTI